MIADAEQLLARASTQGPIGRFQLEAAIQSVHAHRAVTGRIGWDEIALLYEGLVRIAPTVGALVGRAAAVAESLGPAAGWNHLAHIPRPDITDYQPYWALAAHLLRQLGRQDDARDAYGRAIGLCMDQAMRTYLQQRRVELATPRPDAPH
jgi:predicted RNA polymerase sigma factor